MENITVTVAQAQHAREVYALLTVVCLPILCVICVSLDRAYTRLFHGGDATHRDHNKFTSGLVYLVLLWAFLGLMMFGVHGRYRPGKHTAAEVKDYNEDVGWFLFLLIVVLGSIAIAVYRIANAVPSTPPSAYPGK